MLASILKLVSGIVAIVDLLLARAHEENLREQGREQVKSANTEEQLHDLQKANEIDKNVSRMSDDDLDGVLLGHRHPSPS